MYRGKILAVVGPDVPREHLGLLMAGITDEPDGAATAGGPDATDGRDGTDPRRRADGADGRHRADEQGDTDDQTGTV
jgi:simple sugar transport system ATP-binding protein